ncbi:MAG: TMEM175 family protein [Gemmatimonadaceae bacterium]
MIRGALIERHADGARADTSDEFRWRSFEPSRLEGLSDAVFGFAITLLVVSLEVPRNFSELEDRMRGFLAFAISFAMLVTIWYAQFKYFRRYALHDTTSVVLNITLLFVVLFYVYPLKFLFGLLVNLYSGHTLGITLPDGAQALGVRQIGGEVEPVIRGDQWPRLMQVYALGYMAIYALFMLMTLHAYRLRDRLELTVLEAFDTRSEASEHAVLFGVGLISLLLATIADVSEHRTYAFYAGMLFPLIGPIMWAHGTFWGRRRRTLRAAITAERDAGAVPVAPVAIPTVAPVATPASTPVAMPESHPAPDPVR